MKKNPTKKFKETEELDRIAKMLVRRDFELMRAKEELEEAKTVLEIKVKARTRELEELTESLEEKVKERTKKLQEKIEELEESRTALTNILRDVEEARRKAGEERNKTLAIINNFADGLCVFDKENKLLLVNPQAESFLKIKTNEVKGKLISELTKYANLKPLIDLLGKEVKDIFRKELAIKEDLILEISIVSMVSGKEKLGKLIILHDITREKIVEKMKTEFVSLSAHQLRTPLSAIKWILKMFLDGDVGEITFEQKNLLKKAYQSNERMIFLINDLLNVARIEEGKYLYKSKLVSIEDIIESIIKSLQQEIKRKRLIFEFKKPKEKLAPIMIDAEKMQLAIQNLIENAVRYTKMGGRVTIVLKGDGKEIEFSVQDTGIGIPQEYQKRIFTKFFRGTNAVKMETEGSGLGLFISKNIIEAHKGRVWFESKKSKGSTFYFTLPIKNDKI